MPNGTYGGVRGRKTKVGRKLSFSSYSIDIRPDLLCQCKSVLRNHQLFVGRQNNNLDF